MRVALVLSYNGAYFQGFQQQTHTQNTIIGALSKALRALGIFNTPVGSGRTDAGVHALRQVLHLDLPHFWSDLNHLQEMLNQYLNPTLHVKDIRKVHDNFHARYDAIMRHYRYIIWHKECLPHLAHSVAFMPEFSLDLANSALKLMEGKHDFALFKKEGSDTKSTKRILYEAFCYKKKDLSIFTFKANGFLRSQVRLMVAAAIECANQRLSLKELQEQLECKKLYFKKPAPASGLYLVRIHYRL